MRHYLFSSTVELSEYVDDAQLFLDALHNVFFLQGVDELFSMLHSSALPKPDPMIEMIVTHRIAPTQILFGALGWQHASRLPGYFGNMAIAPAAEVVKVPRQYPVHHQDVRAARYVIAGLPQQYP